MKESKILVNPFLFPSELSFYFVLLLISVSAPAFSLCFSTLEHPRFVQMLSPSYLPIYFPLLTFIFLPILTFFFYIKGMRDKIQKYGKNELNRRCPEVLGLITHLCQRMQIKAPNSLYLDTEDLQAVVFGSEKRPYVLVSRGLCEKFKTFPDLVEVVLTHELSHIKNRDLRQHAVSESLWKSFAVIALLGSICGLLFTGHENIYAWARLTILFYLVPCLVVFYLNNAIQRWREIYADVRTIAFQESDRNLVTLLRLFYPISRSSLTAKLFSPFILTPSKRIRIIREDVFKHIVERGTICAAVSIFSLSAVLLSFISLQDITGPAQLYAIGVVWFSANVLLYFIVLLPYWIYSSKEVKNSRHHAFKLFVTPFKISLILTIPIMLVQWLRGSEFYLLISFLTLIYLLLVIHQLLFQFILSFVSSKIRARNKILLSETILLLPLVGPYLYLLNSSEALLVSVISLVLMGVLLFFAESKFSKCPYCGRDIELFSLFRCAHCLHRLNDEFLIFLRD